MNWNDIQLPDTPRDLPDDFATLVVAKARSLAPDLASSEACKTLRRFLQSEISFLQQAEQHHRQWTCVYHENVALAEVVELEIYQNILEQLPSVG